MRQEQFEKIRKQLLDMTRSNARWDLVKLWNGYCEKSNYSDDMIYYNAIDEMENYFSSIADFYHRLGEYVESDDFFAFDGCGILNSFDCLDNIYSPVDFDLLAEWLAGDELRCRQYDIEIDDDDKLN